VNQRHTRADAGEHQRILESRIAATDYHDIKAGKEKMITGRSETHTAAFIEIFTRHAKTRFSCAHCKHEGTGSDPFAVNADAMPAELDSLN
jgi:hypothetical protein